MFSNNILALNQIGLGNEILDPEDAFKMTVTEIDDSLLINWEIEKTYYLYQNSIKVTHKNRSVEFELIGDPVVHKDEFLGETVIYRNSLDLEILDTQNKIKYIKLPTRKARKSELILTQTKGIRTNTNRGKINTKHANLI